MIYSYFQSSWRTLLKNRISSLINISGLTIGLTITLLIVLVVLNEFRYDRFHQHLPDLYVLMKNQTSNDGVSTGESTAGPICEALKTEFPEVSHAARVSFFHDIPVAIDGKQSRESGIYTDPDLFEMMSFRSIAGDASAALHEGSSVVLTRSMAKKLFADENPIGKIIQLNRYHQLRVGAVIEDIPEHSSLRFEMTVPMSLFEKENEWLSKWDDNRLMTFLQLTPDTNLTAFDTKMTTMLQQRSNDKTVSLFAYPLKKFYLYGSFYNGHPDGGRITAVYMLAGFGVFMLLIACINFMNIATAQSEHRAREVGIRKTLGASRKGIIFQFLNESFILTFLSLLIAVALTALIIPYFNTTTHSNIHLDFTNTSLWMAFVTVGIVTALLAGSYPALFLSRFIPAKVLKGKLNSHKGGGLRRTLVAFQFSISIFCLISTIIMYAQFEHVRQRPLGYTQENLIDIQLDSLLSSRFDFIKTQAIELSSVNEVTGSSENILYSGGAVTGMDWPGKKAGEELSINIADVDYNWSKTMGLTIVQGRDFDPASGSDSTGCLLNENAVAQMGLQHPIGSVVGGHPVIGVVKNFVFNNPMGRIAPMAIYLQPTHVNHLYLRINQNEQWRQTLTTLEKQFKQISPEFPFRYTFTKDQYQNHFNEIADTSLMISIFGGMTIFISCLGLFGLAGFIAEKRSKEMSIRKVFGAGTLRLLTSLTQDFLRPVCYALFIMIPISLWAAQSVLSNLSYRVTLAWWMFASAAMLILLISAIIVLFHGWRTARENPVIRLRNE